MKNEHFLVIDTKSMCASRYKGNKHTGEITRIDNNADGNMAEFLETIDLFREHGWGTQ